jgi:hypothetical protein
MPTNLAIDDLLIEETRRLGQHRAKKEAVTAALEEYVQLRKQLDILWFFETIDFDPSYNYKLESCNKRCRTRPPRTVPSPAFRTVY